MAIKEGISTKEDIDKACVLGLGLSEGIFRLADRLGLDLVVDTLNRLYESTGWEAYKPNALLVSMVKEGKLGRRAGEGFYTYVKYEEVKLSTLIIRFEPPIAWIILNRPDRLNAITIEMIKELNKSLDDIEERDDIRVVILTGSGRAFSAGADVTAFAGVTSFKAAIYSRRFQEILNKLEYYTKPIIIAINGVTLGGGMEIAAAGDFRIASEIAVLGQPEINLGIIPGVGGTQRLSRLIGVSRAKKIIYTGNMISAEEAYRLGLVNKVVPPEELKNEARRLAMALSERPPLALLAAKYAIQLGAKTNIWTGQTSESPLFGLLFSTNDFIEGVTAFMEKRKPKFKGK